MNNKKVYSCRPISIRSLGIKPGKARVVAANRLTGVRMNAYGRSLLIMNTPNLSLEWCGSDVSLDLLTLAAPGSLAECCPITPAVEAFFGLTKEVAPKAAPKVEVKEEVKEEVAPKAETIEEAPAPKKTAKKKASKKAAAQKVEAPVEEPKIVIAPEEPKPAPAPKESEDVDPFA
jgi:hypothetical protein